MEEAGKVESLSSAAAFVEGGIQDACDDACSICLEEFCAGDPSTVTTCKHEFHLQCILEWCQRSSQCPMCWQALSLKDPTSQELLEGVERERSIRANRSRNATIFQHPALGNFELQHIPVGANDVELEERIIQHLAAAAAMSRTHHVSRREGHRGRSSAHGHPQFLVFSTTPNTSSLNSIPASSVHSGGENEPAIFDITASPSAPVPVASGPRPLTSHTVLSRADEVVSLPSGNSSTASNMPVFSNSRSFAGQSSVNNQESDGPSDFQSFSESLKSRLTSVSMRYKDSITRSTRGWRDKFLSRNASMSDFRSEVKREVHAGITTVSRMMERLETRENSRSFGVSGVQNIQDDAATETNNEEVTETCTNTLSNNGNTSASCAASSGHN